MVMRWRNYIRGVDKDKQYEYIREQREKAVAEKVQELTQNGAKVLDDYPGYLIMPDGEVYSTLNTKTTKLKAGRKSSGYRFVGLTDKNGNRKYEMIHRLVCKAFIPRKDCASFEVNHKDGNKDNNAIENLEWVTAKQNTKHRIEILNKPSRSKKLTADDVKLICFDTHGSYRQIGAKFGVSAQTVCNIKRKSNYHIELKEVGLL